MGSCLSTHNANSVPLYWLHQPFRMSLATYHCDTPELFCRDIFFVTGHSAWCGVVSSFSWIDQKLVCLHSVNYLVMMGSLYYSLSKCSLNGDTACCVCGLLYRGSETNHPRDSEPILLEPLCYYLNFGIQHSLILGSYHKYFSTHHVSMYYSDMNIVAFCINLYLFNVSIRAGFKSRVYFLKLYITKDPSS